MSFGESLVFGLRGHFGFPPRSHQPPGARRGEVIAESFGSDCCVADAGRSFPLGMSLESPNNLGHLFQFLLRSRCTTMLTHPWLTDRVVSATSPAAHTYEVALAAPMATSSGPWPPGRAEDCGEPFGPMYARCLTRPHWAVGSVGNGPPASRRVASLKSLPQTRRGWSAEKGDPFAGNADRCPYLTLRHPWVPIYLRDPYQPKGAKGAGNDAQPVCRSGAPLQRGAGGALARTNYML